MGRYLERKSIAVTGAGRGIGRAVALACAEAGASVVVNDYGVSIDGREPTSEVANEVVAEIEGAGGRAVANANSVATMDGGATNNEQPSYLRRGNQTVRSPTIWLALFVVHEIDDRVGALTE